MLAAAYGEDAAVFVAAGMRLLRVKVEASLHGADGDGLPDTPDAAQRLARQVCASARGRVCVHVCVCGVIIRVVVSSSEGVVDHLRAVLSSACLHVCVACVTCHRARRGATSSTT